MECQMEVINCPREQIAGHIADGHTRITKTCSLSCWSRRVCKCCTIHDGSMGRRSPVIYITGSSSFKDKAQVDLKKLMILPLQHH